MKKQFVYPYKEDLLLLLGDMTLSWSILDQMLKLLSRDLMQKEEKSTNIITARLNTKTLLDILNALYLDTYGSDERYQILKALFARINNARETRNTIIHSHWGGMLDGSPALIKTKLKPKTGLEVEFDPDIINQDELKEFNVELKALAYEVHDLHKNIYYQLRKEGKF